MKVSKQTWAIAVLAIVYMVGLTGFLLPSWRPVFEGLTPVNLLFASFLVFAFHRPWSAGFVAYFIAIYLAGFFIELVGVKTGVIFGEYHYDGGLGPKLWDVPLIIGLNWILLIYCTGTIASFTRLPLWGKALVGAALMVALDVLIEPFAIKYGLWSWKHPEVPFLNYIAWFFISFVMLLPFFYHRFSNHNRVAVALYIVQVVFFGVLLWVG